MIWNKKKHLESNHYKRFDSIEFWFKIVQVNDLIINKIGDWKSRLKKWKNNKKNYLKFDIKNSIL